MEGEYDCECARVREWARGFTKWPRHTPIDTHRARESHAFVVRPGEREGERDREREMIHKTHTPHPLHQTDAPAAVTCLCEEPRSPTRSTNAHEQQRWQQRQRQWEQRQRQWQQRGSGSSGRGSGRGSDRGSDISEEKTISSRRWRANTTANSRLLWRGGTYRTHAH
mgnify:CR=1 FL=1